jgi:hypothetical protein
LVGAGNVKYFGWTDEIVVWEIPGLARLATVELTRKGNFDGEPVVAHCPRLSSDGHLLIYEDGLDSFIIRDVLDADNSTQFKRDSTFGAQLQFRAAEKELVSLITKPMDQEEDDVGVHVVIHDLDTGKNRLQYLGRVYQLPSISHSLGGYRYDWKRQKEGLSYFQISPQGKLIAFFRIPENEQTGTVEVWNIEPWQRKFVMDAPFGFGSLTFSDNEERLAVISTASTDLYGDRNNLVVIDIPSNEVLIDMESTGEPNHSYFADFSPEGTLLATGTRNNGVQIWDVASGKRIGYARLGDGRRPATYSTGLVFSKDATELYVINASGELRTVSLADIIAPPEIH